MTWRGNDLWVGDTDKFESVYDRKSTQPGKGGSPKLNIYTPILVKMTQ